MTTPRHLHIATDDTETRIDDITGTIEAAKKLREIAAAARPNIRCYSCGHPLGVRPPGGPRGESPPCVYIRTARAYTYRCSPLWWEVPGDKNQRACVHARYFSTLAVLEVINAGSDPAHIAECPERGLHELASRVEALVVTGKLDIGEAGERWTDLLGTVQLIRWKSSAILDTGGNVFKMSGDQLAGHRVTVLYSDDGKVKKTIWVPGDSTAVFMGTRGRCPKCRHVQRLE